jgi:hypothetical protein
MGLGDISATDVRLGLQDGLAQLLAGVPVGRFLSAGLTDARHRAAEAGARFVSVGALAQVHWLGEGEPARRSFLDPFRRFLKRADWRFLVANFEGAPFSTKTKAIVTFVGAGTIACIIGWSLSLVFSLLAALPKLTEVEKGHYMKEVTIHAGTTLASIVANSILALTPIPYGAGSAVNFGVSALSAGLASYLWGDQIRTWWAERS